MCPGTKYRALLPLTALSEFRHAEVEKMYDLKERRKRARAVQYMLIYAERY